MGVFHGIDCDGCGSKYHEDRGSNRAPIEFIRKEANRTGWLAGVRSPEVLNKPGKYDFCPVCLKEKDQLNISRSLGT